MGEATAAHFFFKWAFALFSSWRRWASNPRDEARGALFLLLGSKKCPAFKWLKTSGNKPQLWKCSVLIHLMQHWSPQPRSLLEPRGCENKGQGLTHPGGRVPQRPGHGGSCVYTCSSSHCLSSVPEVWGRGVARKSGRPLLSSWLLRDRKENLSPLKLRVKELVSWIHPVLYSVTSALAGCCPPTTRIQRKTMALESGT